MSSKCAKAVEASLHLQHLDDNDDDGLHSLLMTAFHRSAGRTTYGMDAKVPWGLFTVCAEVAGLHYTTNPSSHEDNEENDVYFMRGMQSLPLGRFVLRACLLLVYWDRYPKASDWHMHMNTFNGILFCLGMNKDADKKPQLDPTLPGVCLELRRAEGMDDAATRARSTQRRLQEGDSEVWERRMQRLEAVYQEAARIYTAQEGVKAQLPFEEITSTWHGLRLSARLWVVQKRPDLLDAAWRRMENPYDGDPAAAEPPSKVRRCMSSDGPCYWHQLCT